MVKYGSFSNHGTTFRNYYIAFKWKHIHVVTWLLLSDWVSVTRLMKIETHHFQVPFPMSTDTIASNGQPLQLQSLQWYKYWAKAHRGDWCRTIISMDQTKPNRTEPWVPINKGQLHESVLSAIESIVYCDVQQTKPRSFWTTDSKVNFSLPLH